MSREKNEISSLENSIVVDGVIIFDPKDKTNKHASQSSWKKIAMVMIDGEICQYYNWFLQKRYNLTLNKPLRGAHISFINDSITDIKSGCNLKNDKEVDDIWNILKDKWNEQSIKVVLDLDVRSDGDHWWLNIPNSERELIHSIRNEIGLGRPFFGLHMTIGYCTDKNMDHSKYIVDLCKKFGKEFC